MSSMYILKTKGTSKIPDYIQVRDENFILISHFKVNHPENFIKENKQVKNKKSFVDLIKEMPYGILKKIDI